MVKRYDWYPADNNQATPNRHRPRAPKTRVQPGQICILLSGRFRGKRVVALKQLNSGLVAVTGPYKLNGVPVKRVNHTYILNTSQSVNMNGVNVSSITDDTFKRESTARRTRSQRFFQEDAPKTSTSDARKKLQKDVDTALLKNISDKMVRKYLGARFSLGRHDAPHAMRF